MNDPAAALQALTIKAEGTGGSESVTAAGAAAATPSSAPSSSTSSSASRVLNINVGILGHVDSGKTSLAKALSTVASTASLDRLPQSQARGITLDLGFSAFTLPHTPESVRQRGFDALQVTLVDCPGHASLIRTIIGGASIIDLMLLVLDSQKLVQTQTAECMVLGEILAERMIVVLNKTDLLGRDANGQADEKERQVQLAKIERQLRSSVFAHTKFGRDVPIVAVAANPGSSDDLKIKDGGSAGTATAASAASAANAAALQPPQVQPLIAALNAALEQALPARLQPLALAATAAESSAAAAASVPSSGSSLVAPSVGASLPFLFAVDHCFQMKGAGTVLTGTVLQGSVRVGGVVEVAGLGEVRKVKSMQRFRQSVEVAVQGDRVGICVTQLDASLIERGLLCSPPGSVGSYSAVIAVVERVRFFKGKVETKQKFHVSIGHATAVATAHFFGGPVETMQAQQATNAKTKQQQAGGKDKAPAGSQTAASASSSSTAAASSSSKSANSATAAAPVVSGLPPIAPFDWNRDYPYRDELLPSSRGDGGEGSVSVAPYSQFAVLEFEGGRAVQAPLGALLLGSRLDGSVQGNSCRIAFSGRLLCPFNEFTAAAAHSADAVASAAAAKKRASLRVFKPKHREGVVDRLVDDRNLIGRELFAKDADAALFVGRNIELEATGARGVIEGAFGQGGKFRAHFPQGFEKPPPSVAAAPSVMADAPNAASVASAAAAIDVTAAAGAAAPGGGGGKKAGGGGKGNKAPQLKSKIIMRFKKYIYALDKKQIVQD